MPPVKAPATGTPAPPPTGGRKFYTHPARNTGTEYKAQTSASANASLAGNSGLSSEQQAGAGGAVAGFFMIVIVLLLFAAAMLALIFVGLKFA